MLKTLNMLEESNTYFVSLSAILNVEASFSLNCLQSCRQIVKISHNATALLVGAKTRFLPPLSHLIIFFTLLYCTLKNILHRRLGEKSCVRRYFFTHLECFISGMLT